MPPQLYFRRGEKVIGPRSPGDASRMLAEKKLIPTDQVSTDANGPWFPISHLSKLLTPVDASPRAKTPSAATPSANSPSAKSPPAPPMRVSVPPPVPDQPSPVAGSTEKFKQGFAGVKNLLNKGRDRLAEAYAEATSRVDESETILLKPRLVMGRHSASVDKSLEHPMVSAKHAMLEAKDGTVTVSDLGSRSGTFVNGERIHHKTKLKPRDTITIGPYTLTFDGEHLISSSPLDNSELVCHDVTKIVKNRQSGEEITILNRVTLIARPREFTVLLGPSGSGKSTLLNALAVRSLPTSGRVTFAGKDLYANFDSLKQRISLVPQKDVLHDALTTERALRYTASLRLPPDTTAREIRELVTKQIAAVDLQQRANIPISSLSGGQIKRASVANEIIADPNLLFVDEATSGLDEHTDGEIMQIFRQIAENGKTVVCITHNLTNVEKFCHKVVILAPGGFLAFVGTPAEARKHFQIDSLGEIYSRLMDRPGNAWKAAFEATEYCQQMYQEVGQILANTSDVVTRLARPTRLQHIGNFVRQTFILLKRGIELQMADRKALAMLAGQCLFVAMMIIMLLGGVSASDEFNLVKKTKGEILFVLSISSFWFGCNNAAKEIVKERTIYDRERSVSLNLFSFLSAKFLILGSITAAQILALLFIVSACTLISGNIFTYGIALILTGICGVSLGLLISAMSPSTDVATTAVPIAVIPQVILSGMIGKISGLAKIVSCIFVPGYWSFGSLIATSTIKEKIQLKLQENSPAEESWLFSISVILFHIALLNSATCLYLLAQDRRWSVSAIDLEKWFLRKHE